MRKDLVKMLQTSGDDRDMNPLHKSLTSSR